MFDIQKMMKQAQKMQDDMKKVQQELEATEFTGTSGSGAVTIVINGKYDPIKIKISPDAAGDADMLEDLVLAALKDANSQVSTALESKMGGVTAGLNIPGLNLPF